MTFYSFREDISPEELARDLGLTAKYVNGFWLLRQHKTQYVDTICHNPVRVVTIPNDPKFKHIVRRALSLSYLHQSSDTPIPDYLNVVGQSH